MSDVFISYSRKNSAFARRLIDRLTLLSKDAWVDWEGIPLTSPNWWAEITAGIEGADNFVFILSPDSMASVVCNMELDYAIDLNKRIVPVLLEEVSTRDAFASIADFTPDEAMEERLTGQDPLVIARDNWQRLSHINWVFFREEDDFDAAFEALIATVETDLQYVKSHTRYLVRAQEWEREHHRADLLLFGEEIDRAEAWLREGEALAEKAANGRSTNNPLPMGLHREYIRVSRQADRRRRRLVRSAQVSIVALSVMLIAGLLLAASIIRDTEREADRIQATSAQDIALARTQVSHAEATVASAQRRADLAAAEVAQQQATSEVVSAQIVEAQATMTQSAIVQDIVTVLANAQILYADQPEAQISHMNTLVRIYPDEALAWFSRALLFGALGDLEGAIADYDEALRLDSGYVFAYNNRGTAKSDLGDLEGAIADYEEALRLDPDNAAAYNNRGTAKSDLGDLEGAIADYDEALRLDPDNAAAYYNRGTAKSDLGDLEGAIADYDETLRLDPDNAAAYYNRGNAKYDLGDLEGAMADYEEALRLDPGDAAAYNNRGKVKYDLGDLEGAIADYSEALRLDPDLALAYYNRGAAEYDLGNLEGAIANYSEALRLDPDFAAAYVGRGDAKYDLGNVEGAMADYDEALRLNPDYVLAYNNRGYAKFYLGDLEGAIADYDEALRLDPGSAAAYNNRGYAKFYLGDLEGAIADFDEAIRLDPGDAAAYVGRGIAYYSRSVNRAMETREADLLRALSDWREAERLGLTLPPVIQDAIVQIELELGLMLTPMPTAAPEAADSNSD